MPKTIIAIIIIIIVAGLGYWVYQLTLAPEEEVISEGSKNCVNDNDCVVFGETGNCNCGCYNKDSLPSPTGGECFCLVPTSCKCVNDKCEGIFEEEVALKKGKEMISEEGEISQKEEKKPASIPIQITFLENLAADPSWSPDGSKIVFFGLREKPDERRSLYD